MSQIFLHGAKIPRIRRTIHLCIMGHDLSQCRFSIMLWKILGEVFPYLRRLWVRESGKIYVHEDFILVFIHIYGVNVYTHLRSKCYICQHYIAKLQFETLPHSKKNFHPTLLSCHIFFPKSTNLITQVNPQCQPVVVPPNLRLC